MSVVDEIIDERNRQIKSERWTLTHDDAHSDGSLADAAACYALAKPELSIRSEYEYAPRGECQHPVAYPDIPRLWPRSWHCRWWKPKDRRRDLIRAAALIVAEIERLDRQQPAKAA